MSAPPSPQPAAAPEALTPPRPEFRMFLVTDPQEEMPEVSAMYFLKPEAGVRIVDEDIETVLDYGLLTDGPQLSELEVLLNELYIPMLQQTSKDGGFADLSLDRNEMLGNLQKFSAQVSHAIKQLTGDIHLNIPSISLENIDKASEDYDTITLLESAIAEWTAVLASAIHRETEKVTAPEKGPLAEINYWRDRNAALSSLYEQLNLPNVKRMVTVVEVGSTDINLIASFKSQFGELTKLYVEAKDNVKFLTTLERHFKNISHGSLTQILDTLSPMMGALRMVWIISRHYSDDTRMGTLFERIANEIGNRVAAEINVKVLFTWSPADATARISLAKSVLEYWSEIYLQVRELIELSARDQRWEFDRKKLFDRTNYMASICKDILQMVEVVDDFHKFLGPELKAVTGDSQGIDSVIMRVQQMVDPIENLQFDAFEKKFQTQWQGVNAKFTTDKEQIERATRAFIDSSFKKLRSAEGAFELLQNFKSIKSEGAINRQMMDKFNDILEQFSREIDTTRDIFEANKARPPVTRNQPPVAGAINWSRSLFQRIRKTYNRLAYSEDEEMMQEEAGHDVQRKYLSLAKAMMQFEKSWFSSWAENVDGLAMTHLKQAIVCKDPGGVIVVNFHEDLTRLIRETRYSDRMGFTIPETALNVTLQEEKYHGYVEGLRMMLENYHNAIAALTPVEKSLLAKRLVKLEKVLKQPTLSFQASVLITRPKVLINRVVSIGGEHRIDLFVWSPPCYPCMYVV
jgi:dynein heavy chain